MVFFKMGDADYLAKKILELKKDSRLRDIIAKNGHDFFIKNLIPIKIIKDLIKIL
jgi:hypothetical protein